MSAERPSGGPLSRRAVLGAIARWSVPTVVTFTLGARVLEAKASCPPCQKKVGTVCKACSVSQMLNCSCEPCLGPPYCSAVGPSAPAGARAPGSQNLTQPSAPGGAPSYDAGANPYLEAQRQRALQQMQQQQSPFGQPLYRDPFGVERGAYGRPTQRSPGLYDRLRPDSLARRRP